MLSFRKQKNKPQRAGTDLAMQQVLNVKRTRLLPSFNQLKQLPRFLSSRERKIGLLAVLLAVASVATLAGQFLFTHLERVPAAGGEYTEGMIGYPHYINPLYASSNEVDATLARLTFAGLMRMDPQEGLVPDIAESYTISPDERSYTFILREGVTWHDGEPLTSRDVLFTVSALQNPDFGSPLSGTLAGITVEANDPRTVSFTLPEPFAPFLSLMTTGVLPAHIWENIPPANAQLTQLNLKPIGSGPYIFDKLIKDSRGTLRSITFTRNPDYHRATPYVQRMTFKFFPNSVELIEGLRNHSVEGTAMLTAAEMDPFRNDRALSLTDAASRQFVAAFFNLKTEGVLADAEVRKALEIAVDRAALMATLPAHTGRALDRPLLEGVPGFDATHNTKGADTTSAVTALETAGWNVPEGGGPRAKDGKTLSFTITVLDIPEFITVAETLAAQWNAIGAQATVTKVDDTVFESSVLKNRSYDILLAGAQYGVFPDPYPFWHSSQAPHPGLNVSQLISKGADDAVATIRATADVNARATAFNALATAIEEPRAAVFLYQSTVPMAFPSGLKNAEVPLLSIPADRFADVQEWYLKTRPTFNK